MPTYTVRTANLSLDDDQRQRIASAITETHSSSTGAPGYFAQIFFDAAPQAAHFVGQSLASSQAYRVRGYLAARRGPRYEFSYALEGAARDHSMVEHSPAHPIDWLARPSIASVCQLPDLASLQRIGATMLRPRNWPDPKCR